MPACSLCNRTFSTTGNLNKHRKKFHNVQINRGVANIQCPLCDDKFVRYAQLDQHLVSLHNISVEVEEMIFSSEEQFTHWKESIEESTTARFVRSTGGVSKGSTIYYCHRSGKSVALTKPNRRRSLKLVGSNKIGSHCPARILTKPSSSCVEVKYVKTHVGHTAELKRVPLKQSERKELAEKLKEKKPLDAILNDIRNSVSEGEVKRKHLVTRRDLHNIAREFKIDKEGIFHANDATSVAEWVKSLSAQEENPVRLYKPQGEISSEIPLLEAEDFMLVIMTHAQRKMLENHSEVIIVDDTRATNSHGFELFSILVVDSQKEGFPCVFIFSSRQDETALQVAFQCIKTVVGHIASCFFMSDNTSLFFNAWTSTFEFAGARYLNDWHVRRAWKKSLSIIKGGINVKNEVYEKLRDLLEETDSNTFSIKMNEVTTELLLNNATTNFGTHFSLNYVPRAEMWSYSSRLKAGIPTPIHIKSFHRVLKYNSRYGKLVNRLDKTIHALMTYVRDKEFDRMCALTNISTISNELISLKKRHQQSIDLDCDIVKAVTFEHWKVPSGAPSEEVYTVKKIGTCSLNCPVYCEECRACVHNFECSCIDHAEYGNMCKHIHLVCRTIQSETNAIKDNFSPVSLEMDCESVLGSELCMDHEEIVEEQSIIHVECITQVNKLHSEQTKAKRVVNEAIDSWLTHQQINDLVEVVQKCKEPRFGHKLKIHAKIPERPLLPKGTIRQPQKAEFESGAPMSIVIIQTAEN